MRSNVRHLLISNGWLYLSCNASGIVQRIPLERFLRALPDMQSRTVTVKGWEECAVLKGARTISSVPSGRYLFAACNADSRLCVIDTRTMKMVASAAADSYPVGLDASPDGKYVITTSQGRSNKGGNAVDIFRLEFR